MTIEALASEIGLVTTRDVQDVSLEATDVVLLVLRTGAPPIRQRVAFGAIAGGRGLHRGLVCPTCSESKYKLFASASDLGCGACTHRLSRRQREHRLRSWRRLGGDLEDVVLRGLRPGRRSSAVPEAIVDAATVLMADDRERAVLLLRRADDAFKGAVTANVSARDALEKEDL